MHVCTIYPDFGIENTFMSTKTIDAVVQTQTSQALKPWSAPKMEKLALALNTLTVDSSGNGDGGGPSTSKS